MGLPVTQDQGECVLPGKWQMAKHSQSAHALSLTDSAECKQRLGQFSENPSRFTAGPKPGICFSLEGRPTNILYLRGEAEGLDGSLGAH